MQHFLCLLISNHLCVSLNHSDLTSFTLVFFPFHVFVSSTCGKETLSSQPVSPACFLHAHSTFYTDCMNMRVCKITYALCLQEGVDDEEDTKENLTGTV